MKYFHRVTTIFGMIVALSSLTPSAYAQLLPTQQPQPKTQADNINPSLQLPTLTGPYQVGTTSYHFVDRERNDIYAPKASNKRELMVYVWYPSQTIQPETMPAPYQDEEVLRMIKRAFAKSLGLKPDIFAKLLIHSVQTRANSKAPLSTAQASYPLLIFSPAFGVPPKLDTSLLEQLASHGYVVVSISHTYDEPTVFPDGRVTRQSSHFHFSSSNQKEIKPVFDQDVDIRALDASFVLDELAHLNVSDPQGLFTNHLDLNRVGIFGHSLGGATAAEAMLLDHRFKAGINLDGAFDISADEDLFSTGAPTGSEKSWLH